MTEQDRMIKGRLLQTAARMLSIEASEWRYRRADKEPYGRTQDQHNSIAAAIDGMVSLIEKELRIPA